MTHGRAPSALAHHNRNISSSGVLFDVEGRSTNVSLELSEFATHQNDYADHSSSLKPCTSAFREFGGCMCDTCSPHVQRSAGDFRPSEHCSMDCNCDAFRGGLSYSDAPGWQMTYRLSGLDPSCKVSLTFYVDRAPATPAQVSQLDDYSNRYTIFTLQESLSYVAAVSSALESLDQGASLVIRSGRNEAGHIAQWTNIVSNGTIAVVASHDRENRLGDNPKIFPKPHPYKAYAGGLMKIEQHCEAAPTNGKVVPITTTESNFAVAATPHVKDSWAQSSRFMPEMVVVLVILVLAVAAGVAVLAVWRRKRASQKQNPNSPKADSGETFVVGKPVLSSSDKGVVAGTLVQSGIEAVVLAVQQEGDKEGLEV